MLVLTRKPGEALRIGRDVCVRVVSSSRQQVRLAIEAPEEVSVYREELFARIAQANREAACSEEVELPRIEEPPEPTEMER